MSRASACAVLQAAIADKHKDDDVGFFGETNLSMHRIVLMMESKIRIEPYVDKISMPENVRIGDLISEHRRKCTKHACSFDYYGFAFGQSPFPVPESVQRALCEHADRGMYSSAVGIEELRSAIASFSDRYYSLDVDPERIFVGPGTKEVISIIFDTIEGDILIPTPSWIGYGPLISLLQKTSRTFKLDVSRGYKINPDDLDKALSENRRQHMVVLNNPHNPTGALYTKDELVEIARVCDKHNALVLADEIYALTTYDFDEFTSMGAIYPEGTFVTNGISKDRSAGGYRLGYAILPSSCPEKVKDAFSKVAATVYTNVATPIQHAGIAAFEQNDDIDHYFSVTRSIHEIVCRYASRRINKIGYLSATTPRATFYIYVNFNAYRREMMIRGITSSNELSNALLSHPYHLAVVAGEDIMLEDVDFGARFAIVDYDGAAAMAAYEENRPTTEREREEFVETYAPRIVKGIDMLELFIDDLT
jgi:aspartate aminotransferase